MPKVLHITDKPVPGGGIRRIVTKYCEMAKEHGWQTSVFRLVHKGDLANSDPYWGPVRITGLYRSTSPLAADLRDALQGVDVVHLHLGFAAIDAAFVDAIAEHGSLIVSIHDISPFLHQKSFSHWYEPTSIKAMAHLKGFWLKPIRRKLWQTLCQQANTILAPSQFLADLAKEYGVGDGKIRILHHPITDIVGYPAPPSESKPIALYVGSLICSKGVSLLLEAFSILNLDRAELVIVGDGELRSDLEAEAVRLGCNNRVHFRGYLSELNVQKELAKARILVHPSLIAEGFGLTGVEAMRAGRPVVGFGLGGTRDWLTHEETGLIARTTDAADLAACICRLMTDDVLADRLGDASRKMVVERFDEKMIAGALISIYRDAQNSRVPGHGQ